MTPPNRARAPRRRAWLALALLVLATAAGPLDALQELSGQIVRAIEVHGLKTLSEETLLYYLGLEVGKPLDQGELNRNIQVLWGRELVDDLKVDSQPVDGRRQAGDHGGGAAGPALDRLQGAEEGQPDRRPRQDHLRADRGARGDAAALRRAQPPEGADRAALPGQGLPLRRGQLQPRAARGQRRARRLHRRRGRPGADRERRLRGQHGLQRLPPPAGDEEDQGDRTADPPAQARHLQPGDPRRGPRQGARPVQEAGLQERPARRSRGRGQGAQAHRRHARRTRSGGSSSPSRSKRGSAGSSARSPSRATRPTATRRCCGCSATSPAPGCART